MKRLPIALLLMLAASATAFGQLGEIWVSGGGASTRNNSLGSIEITPGSAVDLTYHTGFRLEARLTLNNESHFGHEFGYAYTKGNVDAGSVNYFGMSTHQGMYNFLLYGTSEGAPIRPFATGGVHFSSFYPPGASPLSGNGVTKFGFNYGGGVKVRISPMYSVRFDVRDYWQGKPDFGINPEGQLKILVVSAGFGLVF